MNFCGLVEKLRHESRAIRDRSDFLINKVDPQNARKRPSGHIQKECFRGRDWHLALIHDPDVVILDEPMSGLDPIGRKMVGDLLLELKEQGKTVFFSSHILNDIERFSDRAGIIIGGKFRRVDTLSNLLSDAKSLEDVFMKEVSSSGRERIMNVLWAIAVISFEEGIRNRALYGITLFALLLFGATALVAGMIPREVGKVAVDMALSTVSFTGLLLVLFVGINLMAKDLDKRTIYTVLARPISRSSTFSENFWGWCFLSQ